ncbi:uncharacterized protein LOC141852181 isoform X2 [Brevipalpus obovatus]|uniref:uncharacterized protein LOC141852181 isoform X2 n=1 Tax=Brevipalpus obovatus TaxID=246614 RepID=UPI003D9E3A21
MPLSLSDKAKIDCSQNPQSSICQILPLLSRYNVEENSNNQGKDKTLQILFSAQSTAAIIYVIIVLLIYAFVFGALFYSSRGRSATGSEENDSRKTDTVVHMSKNKHRIEYYDGTDDNYV